MNKVVNIEPQWEEALENYFEIENFKSLTEFVKKEYLTKKVFPNPADLFKAFSLTPFGKVRVIILGQDPYHGDGQAHGLSFSVPVGIRVPPSLQNIYKEIENDLGIKKDFSHGNLEGWATEGVLLLNAVLSVVSGSPASHGKRGWEEFTDTAIKTLSDKRENLVFMLWGNFARSKKVLIDITKHLVLEAPHPSPFSAHSGFLGCKHFSKCNDYLKKHHRKEINW